MPGLEHATCGPEELELRGETCTFEVGTSTRARRRDRHVEVAKRK